MNFFKKSKFTTFPAPIFIGGEGRSGTTLMRVILDSHPNIACGPESQLFRDPKVVELFQYLLMQYRNRIQEYSNDPESYLARSFRAMINYFFENYARKQGKVRWAEKSPHNIIVINFLSKVYENQFKFIHMIRDGRDVASSLLTVDWGPNNVIEAAKRWKNIIEIGKVHRGKEYYLEIRYENLVERPEQEIKRICLFINEKYHPSLLRYHTMKHDLGADESSNSQVTQAIYQTAVGRWKKDLSTTQIIEFEKIAGDTLVELGYK